MDFAYALDELDMDLDFDELFADESFELPEGITAGELKMWHDMLVPAQPTAAENVIELGARNPAPTAVLRDWLAPLEYNNVSWCA